MIRDIGDLVILAVTPALALAYAAWVPLRRRRLRSLLGDLGSALDAEARALGLRDAPRVIEAAAYLRSASDRSGDVGLTLVGCSMAEVLGRKARHLANGQAEDLAMRYTNRAAEVLLDYALFDTLRGLAFVLMARTLPGPVKAELRRIAVDGLARFRWPSGEGSIWVQMEEGSALRDNQRRALVQRLDRWIGEHRDRIDRHVVEDDGEVMTLKVVQEAERFDPDLNLAAATLDLEVAHSVEFSGVMLDVVVVVPGAGVEATSEV
ncbi:hypothetical protein [Singulisphaera sp. PoT]|uniref:hypothetical protein n=1 Tax=Singulisphaera sp. PoT TaxID=3411797 RepID=UPI003BF5C428